MYCIMYIILYCDVKLKLFLVSTFGNYLLALWLINIESQDDKDAANTFLMVII